MKNVAAAAKLQANTCWSDAAQRALLHLLILPLHSAPRWLLIESSNGVIGEAILQIMLIGILNVFAAVCSDEHKVLNVVKFKEVIAIFKTGQ